MSAKNSTAGPPLARQREATARLVRELGNVLRFHQALGINEYPGSPELRRFLAKRTAKAGASRPGRVLPPVKAPRPRPEPGEPAGPRLQSLGREAASCSFCPLAAGRLGTVPGSGGESSTLMVVGDWSLQEKGHFSPATIFGLDDDALLVRMMAAIGLQPGDIYVTNCVKCCPPPGQEPDRACLDACFSFLEREIAAVRPRVICAMGDMAARMLLGREEPLVRLRGRMQQFRYQAGPPVAVMPTFHPRFLRRHEEMKKGTWLDLQAIQRHLAGR
ncbi:MAG: hypothetical protein GWP11_07175 [Proteobacteria bacterium]|nr:hypothetical protein [Pseudomonadota bacterium]